MRRRRHVIEQADQTNIADPAEGDHSLSVLGRLFGVVWEAYGRAGECDRNTC